MSKLFIKPFNKSILLLILLSSTAFALSTDKQADFLLDADNFKNLPAVENNETQIKYWGNVFIEQGTLKINAEEAIIFNGKDGISKVVLTGDQVKMEQFIDAQYGKINVKSDEIVFMILQDKLLMTGNVMIKSKVQGEMHGEKITMNLKTKEIKGENAGRVRLIIKPKK